MSVDRYEGFLCHQKWDSTARLPLIPARTPILMLSGVKDEVVPREHMQELWGIVQKRGAGQNAAASEVETGLKKSKYVEFENGTHSESPHDYL